jgi:hypothetical protein
MVGWQGKRRIRQQRFLEIEGGGGGWLSVAQARKPVQLAIGGRGWMERGERVAKTSRMIVGIGWPGCSGYTAKYAFFFRCSTCQLDKNKDEVVRIEVSEGV